MHTITDIPEAWRSVKRILAIRLDNLGDMLLMTPALHAIKESLPGVELSVLAGPVGAQAARLNPDVDDVIVYHSPQMDPWGQLPQDPEREFALIATLRERNFDAAVIFTSFRQSSLPQAYVCYLAGIPLRLAASIDGCGSLLTTRHRHPEHLMHEVERALDLVGAVGFRSNQRDLVLQVPPEARRTAEAWLANACAGAMSRPLIVIHPGCTMPARTYPWQMYSEVADLATSQLNATVVVSGTQDEHELVEQIRNQSRYPLISAAGALAFPEFTALIAMADLVITNNTGPMHMAAALKTPVISLFALTNPPEQWGPWRVPHRQLFYDVPCRICYQRVCPTDHACLRRISPEQVIAAAAALLGEVWAGMPNPPWRRNSAGALMRRSPDRDHGRKPMQEVDHG
ncbi:MAG: glycosyltransferase family 9 protein [Oscillochloris sp.]|nr:glycosyltransferase family 9 protein [Oscillochloris sp.]